MFGGLIVAPAEAKLDPNASRNGLRYANLNLSPINSHGIINYMIIHGVITRISQLMFHDIVVHGMRYNMTS